jgi:hypothetical protein
VTKSVLNIRGQFDDLYAGIGGLTNLVTKYSGEKADFRELDEHFRKATLEFEMQWRNSTYFHVKKSRWFKNLSMQLKNKVLDFVL